MAINDGSANAPVGPAQLPALLYSYAVRPLWKVAGVDYAVGYPAYLALKDWQTINQAGVSVSTAPRGLVVVQGNNVTLSGYDFSLHGGAHVVIVGSNDTISNSNFVYSPLMLYSVIGVTPTASNFTLKYCVVDGNGPTLGHAAADQTALIGGNGSGTTTLQYNWFKNFNQHVVEMGGGAGSLDYQFNLIENGGSGATGQHLNFLQFFSDAAYNPVTVQFNTTYQPTSNPSGGEGFQMYNNGTGNITGTLAYNTMIASPDGSGLPHISGYPSGGGGVTTASVHDNYIAKRGSPTFFYPDPTSGDSYSENINLVTGARIDAPSSSAPPVGVDQPVIKLFFPDTSVVGDGITNASMLTLTRTAAANTTVNVYDRSTQITGSWDHIAAVLTDAKHMLTATATSSSGQTGAASSPLTVSVDTKAPAAPTIVSDSVNTANQMVLSGNAKASSTIKVYDRTTQVGTATTNSSGAWNVTTSALSTGSHSLTAKATDVAGNVSTASSAVDPVIGSLLLLVLLACLGLARLPRWSSPPSRPTAALSVTTSQTTIRQL